MDSPHSVLSMNSDHGSHESDSRQADVSDPAANSPGLIKGLLETLVTMNPWDLQLAQSFIQALNTEETEEGVRQKYEYESVPAQDRDDHNTDPSTAQADSVTFKDPQSPAMLEGDVHTYPVDVSLQLPPNGPALERTLHLKVSETAKMLTVKVLFS